MKGLLSYLLFTRKAFTAKWLGDAVGIHASTVYKHVEGCDDPEKVKERRPTLDELWVVAQAGREARGQVLDLLGGVFGFEWRERAPAAGDQANAVAGADRVMREAGLLTAELADARADNRIDRDERPRVRQRLDTVEHRLKELRAELRALDAEAHQ